MLPMGYRVTHLVDQVAERAAGTPFFGGGGWRVCAGRHRVNLCWVVMLYTQERKAVLGKWGLSRQVLKR